MPIYFDNQSRTFSQTALRFADKFALGDVEQCASNLTHPNLFAGIAGPNIAYKFAGRPGFYRIHWNGGKAQYEIYWMNVKGLLTA